MEERVYTNKTLLVTGSPDWKDWHRFKTELDAFFETQSKKAAEKELWTIAHGGSLTGVDHFADRYATVNGYKAKRYEAKLVKYGVAAKPMRNKRMVEQAKPHAAILFAAEPDIMKRLREYSRLPDNRLWSIKLVDSLR